MTHRISIPKNLSGKWAVKFAQGLNQLPETDDYIFDFKNMSWVDPFGMLFTAQALKSFRNKKKERGQYPMSGPEFR